MADALQAPRDYSAQPLTGAELDAIGGNQHVPGAATYYGGSAFPTGTPGPDRKTSDMDLDAFNTEVRGSELYQQFIHDRGLWKPNGGVTEWSEEDRDEWKTVLGDFGVGVDGGMKIDNAGNINQKNTLGKKLAKVAILTGAGLATIATGGAASPWLATAIGAGAGAGTGAIDGGWKGALIGGATGAAGGYFGGGGRIPGIGGGAGASTTAAGTGTGADLGLTGALGMLPATTTRTVAPLIGAGGNMAGAGGWGSILKNLASDPDTYTTIAGQLGRMGEGQADERGDENRYGADLNRALASLFGAEQGASTQATDAEERGKLDRAGFEESQKQSRAELGLRAPDIRTRQSILGSLLQEMQPFQVGDTGRIKVPKISGGLTPAALNPAARETGSILQKQAIDALLSGSDVPDMTAIPTPTDFQAARLPKPDLNQYQEPGTGESILSGIGAAGNTFASVMEALRKQSRGTGTTPSTGLGA